MAKPVSLPYPPTNAAVTTNGFMSDPWLSFQNKMVAFVSTLTQRGTRADQPAATSVYAGTLYFVTDELVTERSSGTAWESFSA